MINPDTTLLFYDIETSGLNKCFDQVLQFAAIRTDHKLNELERHEIQVKLNPDIIPSPSAVLTHGISPQDCQNGLDEVTAIQRIHELFNTPNTISLGYNTLGFDDEFLRFSFYRNLLPPYTHQYENNCGRMDLYPITIMYFLFNKRALEWPLLDNKPSLKLEHLSQANQLAVGAAHNAMVDVEATLALARKLNNERSMWDYLAGYFNKKEDSIRINKLKALTLANEEYKHAILIDGQCGASALYHCPVLFLGEHNHYKNQTLWLRLDKIELSNAAEETIPENTWVIRKKLGEPGLLLPMEPRFTQYLSVDRQQVIEENKKWLSYNQKLLQAIAFYHKEYKYPKIENIDCEGALYENGFMSDEDKYLCKLFHQSPPSHKPTIISRMNNYSLKQLAIRVMGKYYQEYMTPEMKAEYHDYLKALNLSCDSTAILDYKGQKRLSPQLALFEIAELRKLNTLTGHQTFLLDQLELYIKSMTYKFNSIII